MKRFKLSFINVTTLIILLFTQFSFIYVGNWPAWTLNLFLILSIGKIAYCEKIIELGDAEISRKKKIIDRLLRLKNIEEVWHSN